METMIEVNESTKFKEEISKAIAFYRNGKYSSAVSCIKNAQKICNYENWFNYLNLHEEAFWDDVYDVILIKECIECIEDSDCGGCCTGCCGIICAVFCVSACCSKCGCDCDPYSCVAEIYMLALQCCCGCCRR